jgi:penicillin-binding protein 1A
VAGKTGTSEGGRDLWFIGSIPQLTTGVWLGYDSNKPTGDTSVVATYAWRAFMEPITKTLPVRQFPPRPVLHTTYKGEKLPASGQPPATRGTASGESSLKPSAQAPTESTAPAVSPIPEGTPSNGPPVIVPPAAPPLPPAGANAPAPIARPNLPPPPVAAPPTP